MKAREIAAVVREADDGGALRVTSPEVGFFRAHVSVGDLVRPGLLVGELETLGRVSRVVAPAGARGVVTAVAAPGAAVDFGALLLALDPNGALAAGDAAAAPARVAGAAGGLVFRAPTSGRFYVRASPDKPAFVEAGSELAAGTTICLLEVMKTFNRVTYAATGGLPERARVVAVLVADGADVSAGDALLSLA